HGLRVLAVISAVPEGRGASVRGAAIRLFDVVVVGAVSSPGGLPQEATKPAAAPVLRLDSVQQAADEAKQQDDEERARYHPDPLEPAVEDLSREPAEQIADSTDEAGPNEAVDDLVQRESHERELRQAERDG